eukprot:714951-Amphidinium_carterae.1
MFDCKFTERKGSEQHFSDLVRWSHARPKSSAPLALLQYAQHRRAPPIANLKPMLDMPKEQKEGTCWKTHRKN